MTLTLWSGLDAEALARPGADREAMTYKWLGRWARTMMRIYGVQVRVAGRYPREGEPYPSTGPNGRGRIFVMNHRSGMDILIAFAHVQAHLVSRHDLASWPLVGRAARKLGTLFVDRSSMRSGATVLKAMTRALKQGQGIFIFPEGTAFAGDEVRAFKPGAFNAARRAEAEIVPLGIAYADPNAVYGDESFLEHLERVGAMPRVEAALEVGEPIQVGERTLVELRDLAQERVQGLVHRARARLDEAGSHA
jgi:1-acyl-sn-glycerol-3-phosphate acyltransferase